MVIPFPSLVAVVPDTSVRVATPPLLILALAVLKDSTHPLAEASGCSKTKTDCTTMLTQYHTIPGYGPGSTIRLFDHCSKTVRRLEDCRKLESMSIT